MEVFEFSEEDVPVFHTVGELRELLKDYADDMQMYVCGVPGLFFPREGKQCILLETQNSSGYEVISELAIGEMWDAIGPEYMDF